MDFASQPKETTKMEELKTKIQDISITIRQQELKVYSLKDQMAALEKELQYECGSVGHNFISETEGGLYGDTYTFCSICNRLK